MNFLKLSYAFIAVFGGGAGFTKINFRFNSLRHKLFAGCPRVVGNHVKGVFFPSFLGCYQSYLYPANLGPSQGHTCMAKNRSLRPVRSMPDLRGLRLLWSRAAESSKACPGPLQRLLPEAIAPGPSICRVPHPRGQGVASLLRLWVPLIRRYQEPFLPPPLPNHLHTNTLC